MMMGQDMGLAYEQTLSLMYQQSFLLGAPNSGQTIGRRKPSSMMVMDKCSGDVRLLLAHRVVSPASRLGLRSDSAL